MFGNVLIWRTALKSASGRNAGPNRPRDRGGVQQEAAREQPAADHREGHVDSTLDVLNRRGVLDEILLEDFLHAPLEDDAQDLARKASTRARVCGCCGRKLPSNEPTFFGANNYVGMSAPI
jgi:hypothetical protein